MDINHIHLAVKDVDASKKFYEDNFGFREHVRHGHILFMRNEAQFDLALDPDVAPAALPDWFHFGFRLDSASAVESLFEQLEQQGQFIKTRIQHEEGFVWFRAKDPDGYAIEVYWE